MDSKHLHGWSRGSDEWKGSVADRILATLQLRADDVVYDVGSGGGYYSARFAEHCRKVVAIDVWSDGLASEHYARANIETVHADACAWTRTNSWAAATHVFFSNSFHDMTCRRELLSALARDLRPGACLDLVEFHPDTPFGPPKDIRLSRARLKALVEPYGFREKAHFDLDTHYFCSFERTNSAASAG